MRRLVIPFIVLVFLSAGKLNAQVLNTEDSWPLLPGQVEIGAALKYQTSKEGFESALLFLLNFEYGLSNKFIILVEPVPFTTIHPKTGRLVTGIVNLEMTLFYQLVKETRSMPSVSLSAEIKFPTAKDSLIGTGKTDFTPFLIASKITGKFFTSANISYTFLGKPLGIAITNLFNYALGSVFTASEKSVFFGEVYGNTSATGGKDVPEGTIPSNLQKTTEISGGETVGSLEYGLCKQKFTLSFSVSYDNNHATLFRSGIVWTSESG